MTFRNRQRAGQELAEELGDLVGVEDLIVLGLPRGGVPVAFEIAEYLHAPLDVFLSRKLGVPGQEELAFGAIAANGGRYLDQEIVAATGLSPIEIEKIARATEEKLQERERLYREGRPPLHVEGRTVILVDDGVATGASMYAALRALQGMNPKRLIAAIPVASRTACNLLRPHANRLVVLQVPENFYAVGQFYDDFSQVSDGEVIDLLHQADLAPHGKPVQNDCP
ncbi:MAG TPA: phosphoribosyltransferase [Acidobacteriaceae bacterium]|nr:phosphoribosyltransferase [Acidobacteriaceae bacterium]